MFPICFTEGDDHHPELSAGADEKNPDMFGEGVGTDGKLPSAYDEPDYPYGDWNTTHYTYLTPHSLNKKEKKTVC